MSLSPKRKSPVDPSISLQVEKRSKQPRYTIIVAVDSSPNAARALDHAINIAHLMHPHAYLICLHVTPLNPDQHVPYLDQMERIYNIEAKERAQKIKQSLSEKLDLVASDIQHEYLEISGGATAESEMIVKEVNERMPDLFVMGTRGIGALRKMLMGSVSDYCVKHSKVPVMLVK